ncbi:MAG: hypothetical protein KQI78_07585 [Deltaproteobacteria bacterium]|nr:hypothetical protein [Deltaproteobacteria bacterium]
MIQGEAYESVLSFSFALKEHEAKENTRFPLYPARRQTGRGSKDHAVRQGVKRSEARSNRQIVSTRASLTTQHGGMRCR